MADEPSVKIPEHTILSRLGRGGMASVYLARHDRLGRLVAVKVIDDRFDNDPHFQQRFEREARTAAGLTHPNIVPVHEYGFTADGRPFLTMAFLEGGSLRDRMQKRGPLPIDEALAITRQVAAALLVAHARNIVHRDLKPDNVLFQGDTALLTDFGIAKVLDASTALTGMGSNPGTVKYFSPEQAKEQPIDQRSDIYTLGVVLYEMLTGASPIEGETVMQLIMGIAQRPPEPLPKPLKGLQPFLDVLLAKEPAERIGSCADVIAIIQAMERNWLRFGEVERLTDGVNMTSSSVRAAAGGEPAGQSSGARPAAAADAPTAATPVNQTPRADTDAATLLVVDTVPVARAAAGATVQVSASAPAAPPHDGLTLPTSGARAELPAGSNNRANVDDDPLNDGQTVPMQLVDQQRVDQQRVDQQRAAQPPAAPAAMAAERQAVAAPQSGSASSSSGNNKLMLGGLAALLLVAITAGFMFMSRGPAAPAATAETAPGNAAAAETPTPSNGAAVAPAPPLPPVEGLATVPAAGAAEVTDTSAAARAEAAKAVAAAKAEAAEAIAAAERAKAEALAATAAARAQTAAARTAGSTPAVPAAAAPATARAAPAAPAAPANADRRVRVINETTHTMVRFYASNVSRTSWEEDILGEGTIAAGGSKMINLDDGSGACQFDFKGVFDDKDEVVKQGIDVCKISSFRFTE